jgi:hypothetical protein
MEHAGREVLDTEALVGNLVPTGSIFTFLAECVGMCPMMRR